MLKKILVAIDNSNMTQKVFDEAIFLAKATDANVMILHVLSPLDEQYIDPLFLQPTIIYPQLRGNNSKYAKDWEKLKENRLNWLNWLRQQATQLGVKAEYSQNIGEPSRMICDIAQNWEADVIVIGRRGRRGISELLMGSVSNYVLHHAPCSVFIVQGIIPPTQETSQTGKVEIISKV
ncbi:MAG: universal stress protein [Rivularia sp. ALOHA_DT_140]|nr:universal stress protein [Rivularia sp. ALOHA_DT_140]